MKVEKFKKMSEKRLSIIMDILKDKNITSTNLILKKYKELGVSKITLRRDLHELEKKNLIKLSYGTINIISEDFDSTETEVEDHRNIERMKQKKKMAMKANEILGNEEIIFVSMGTTCEEFVANITKKVKLLITNSLNVCLKALKNRNVLKVHFIGGNVDKTKKACFTNLNFDFLNKIYFDKVFTSCVSISDEEEVFYDNMDESDFIKRISGITTNLYLFIDDYKLNKKSFIKTFVKDDFKQIIYFNED